MMGINGGADPRTFPPASPSHTVHLAHLYLPPVVPSNWWRLDDRPVMSSSSAAFGPGHASFPYDRNGVPYVVYHADADADARTAARLRSLDTPGDYDSAR